MESCLLDRMRFARGALHTATLVAAAAPVPIVPASSIRGSLTFFGAAEQYEVFVGGTFASNTGILVPQLSPTPVVLSVQFHGDLVQQCFYARSTLGTTITWAEAIFQGG